MKSCFAVGKIKNLRITVCWSKRNELLNDNLKYNPETTKSDAFDFHQQLARSLTKLVCESCRHIFTHSQIYVPKKGKST